MSRYQLFFRVLLIIWLFWFSFAVLKEYRKARVTNKYEIVGVNVGDFTVPYVLNKEDGRVWKFFIGNGSGFEQVPFYNKHD